MRRLATLKRDDKGATAIEYGLIVSLIVVAILGALTLFSNATTRMYGNISTNVSKVM